MMQKKQTHIFPGFATLSIFVIFFTIMLLAGGSTSLAAEPRLISTHGDWSTYVFTENGNKVCYMAARPEKARGNYKRRGEIFALITHRPAENSKDVFSYVTGYTYKEGSDVTVDIDGKVFKLFTQDDTAWVADSKTDAEIADAIVRGSKMVVVGTSKRGTRTTDTYSLSGTTQAYNTISRECGVE